MISRLTAYVIAERDDIVITHGGPNKEGKFMGWITLGQESRYRPLLNSEAIYSNGDEAEEAMRQTVQELKVFVKNECGDKSPLEHVFSLPG